MNMGVDEPWENSRGRVLGRAECARCRRRRSFRIEKYGRSSFAELFPVNTREHRMAITSTSYWAGRVRSRPGRDPLDRRTGNHFPINHRLPCITLATTSCPQRPGSGWARGFAFNSVCAASSRSTGTAAIACRVGGTPSFSAKYFPIRRPSSAGMTWCAVPLCAIASKQRFGAGHQQ